MAEKKSTTSAPSPSGRAGSGKKSSGERKWLWRMVALLCIVCAIVGGVFAAVKGTGLLLFQRNQHFILRHVDVESSGYWNNRAHTLSAMLSLQTGVSNLFDFDIADIRRKIEAMPNVERCEVRRILPDTLKIHIVERIPRATLGASNSPYLLDTHSVVLDRAQCMNFKSRLPMVLGIRSDERAEPGKTLESARLAVELIMLTIRQFPDMMIAGVNMADPEFLVFVVNYRNVKTCKVKMPRNNLSFHLTALQSAIVATLQRNDPRQNFDLSFNGSVILR